MRFQEKFLEFLELYRGAARYKAPSSYPPMQHRASPSMELALRCVSGHASRRACLGGRTSNQTDDGNSPRS